MSEVVGLLNSAGAVLTAFAARMLIQCSLLIVVLAWPMAFFTREAPRSDGQPEGARSLAPLRAVLASPAFYLLLAGSMCSIAAVGGANQHLKLFLSLDAGYAQADAALIISLVLTFRIGGRLFMGWLSDRTGRGA